MTTVIKEEKLVLTKDDLWRLSEFHNTSCISIYIPTHRAGIETLNGQDALNLKNQMKEIRTKLADQGMNSKQIEKLLHPLSDLVDNADFWRHQSDGLAIFLSDTIFERVRVPVQFDQITYISSDFYLKPLLPVFNDNGVFYLLALKKDGVRFFKGNKHGITEIDIGESVPSRLEDTVGYDFEQKQLQFRSAGGGIFHGHNEGDTKHKTELLHYFREIDKGVISELHNSQEPPLVLCCIDYYVSLYSEANTYNNLFPNHISYNPADLDISSLHEKAWELLEPWFNRNFHDKKERFLMSLNKGKASSDIRKIIPAAVQGKIDTIFYRKRLMFTGFMILPQEM
jgi:hypothetical protein